MTITVVTGTPGAGKTLYTIEKLLLPILGTTVPQVDEDGRTVIHPRTVYTNINGLQVDHELVEHGPAWEYRDKEWIQPGGENRQGVHNWHEWARPGAIIIIDEFQRLWPPRPNGAAVPPDISALDTHRHMGVDFVLITQNVINTDRHIHGLCNVHLHVRRMANMPGGIVYEWDHCSRQLQYSKALTKHPWRYKRRIFKLYRSAEVHTKQRRSLPGAVWFILAGIVGTVVLGPVVQARLSERFSGSKAAAQAKAPEPKPSPMVKAAAVVPAGGASSPVVPVPGPAGVGALAGLASALPRQDRGTLAGCGQVRDVCKCFDTHGQAVEVEASACQAKFSPWVEPARPAPGAAAAAPVAAPAGAVSLSDAAADGELIAFLRGRPGAP